MRRRLPARVTRWAGAALPWLAFFAILCWRWAGRNLLTTLPEYGDVLEETWAIAWYGEGVALHRGFAHYPLLFAPGGWYLAATGMSVGPWMWLAILPLYWLGGVAFAFNVTVLLTFVAAFAGMYLFARRFIDRLPATVAGLLATFWSVRWLAIGGQINLLLCTAAIPWILWTIERSVHSERRWYAWVAAAGVIWALAIAGTMYSAFIAGGALLLWLLGRALSHDIRWSRAIAGLLISGAVALLLSAPGIWWLWQASRQVGAQFFSPYEVNYWGASLNSLFIPFQQHPWLNSLVRAIYHGTSAEQEQVNFGLLAPLLAILAVPYAWRRPGWRPVLLLIPVGVILALGLTLKWDNETIKWPLLGPLDAALWPLLHALKPGFFTESKPPPLFDVAVPLPGMIVAALVPFMERARVFARYAMIAAPGIYLLAGLTVGRLRWRWARLAAAAALVFEVLPPALPLKPFPPPVHPAFTWLQQQNLAGQTIADVTMDNTGALTLNISGDTLWETRYHGQATLSGTSAVWPAYTRYLFDWLAAHPHPFQRSDLAILLRYYRVRYLLVHLPGQAEAQLGRELGANADFATAQCFAAPTKPGGPWPYPICVIEVLPGDAPVNLLLGDGWSAREDWGVWALGTAAQASWVSTTQAAQTLTVTAFPQCVAGKAQQLEISVNGTVVATHIWQDCDQWSAVIPLPAALIASGENRLTLRTAFAASPADLSGGTNNDQRPLSAGFSTLSIAGNP